MYEQYVRNEDFDPFLWNKSIEIWNYYFIWILLFYIYKILFEINSFEINLTLKILKPELENFYKNLEKFTPRLIKFLKYTGYKGHLIDMPHIIEKKFFFEYSEEQFKEVIILNGKYSSGLFTIIEGIFQ